MNYLTRLIFGIIIIFLSPCFVLAEQIIYSEAQLKPVEGVDLGIADDETYRRPNSWAMDDTINANNMVATKEQLLPTERILVGNLTGPASRPGLSIAWRNAAQVEEVEIRVRNLGNTAGEGRVRVDVLDETGKVLLHLEPPDELKVIRVPGYAQGGREGKILRMKANRALNNLIDRYDNERRRYDVRATIETLGSPDANPFDNSKTKSWNIPFAVQPGFRNTYNYIFTNHEEEAVKVHWLFEHTPYPKGWVIKGVPSSTEPFILQPGQSIRGTLNLDAPDNIKEGVFVEARLSLVNTATETVFGQHEWFQVYDTISPTVTDYRLVFTQDHRIAIQALVADNGSGVLEATGVTTEYSTDGGRTWARKAHNYKVGNFTRPTLFEVVLGPFASETKIQLRFTAKDTAGNVTSFIPDDAVAILAPPEAEKLIDFAYIFPRTEANPIFALEPGPSNVNEIAANFAEAISVRSPSEDHLKGITQAITGMQITSTDKENFINAAKRLKENPDTAVAGARLEKAIESMQPIEAFVEPEISKTAIQRVVSPGDDILKMNTLEITVK